MALDPRLSPLTLPFGTEFPGTPQLLLTLIAQYMQVIGIEELGGVNYGPTTPSADNRDKPWFKTDGSYNPIGWYSWNGSTWAANLNNIPSGNTASRPAGPTTGQLYLDTDINVVLVYERAAWRTLSGSPGDIKFVEAATSAAALTNNPGWALSATYENRVVAGASGTHAYGTTIGAETHTLTAAELAPHTHALAMLNDPNGGDHNDSGSDTFIHAGAGLSTESAGDGDPHNNMQPTIYRWALVKQ